MRGCRRASCEHRAAACVLPAENVQANSKPASTRRRQLPIVRPHRQKSTQTSPHENFRPNCRSSPARVACRQSDRPSGLFAEEAFQRSHLQGTKKSDRIMNRQHAINFLSYLRHSEIASFRWPATSPARTRASSGARKGQEDTRR